MVPLNCKIMLQVAIWDSCVTKPAEVGEDEVINPYYQGERVAQRRQTGLCLEPRKFSGAPQ